MAKGMTNRAVAWLLAALLMMMAVPSVALANTVTAQDDATSASDVFFTVYTKVQVGTNDGAAAYAYKAEKTYTKDALAKLADTTNKYGYMLNAKNVAGVYATQNSVDVKSLLKDANVTLAENEDLYFVDGTAYGETVKEYGKWHATYSDLNGEGKFYPYYSASEARVDDAVAVPAVIALSYGTANVETTAKDALDGITEYGASGVPRFFMGIPEQTYSSNGLLAGMTSAQGVTGIIVDKTASQPAFEVYTQSATATDKKLAKSFTWAEMATLAGELDSDGIGVNYMGKGVAKVLGSTSYIEVADLLSAAGIDFAAGDSLLVSASDLSCGIQADQPLTYEALTNEDAPLNFYPNTLASEAIANDPIEVGAVLALNYSDTTIEGADTAEDTLNGMVKSGDFKVDYRWLVGTTPTDYAAGNMAGKRLVTGPTQLVVTRSSIENAVAAVSNMTYTGKQLKPLPSVTMPDGTNLDSKYFTVSYGKNKDVGKGTLSISGNAPYTGKLNATFTITQAANKATAAKTKVSSTFKAAKVKAKAQTVSLPKVTTTFGTAKWSVSKKDAKKVLTLKNGKVQVKKGAKKGTYTIKLKASVTKTANYKAATSKVVTVSVKVK